MSTVVIGVFRGEVEATIAQAVLRAGGIPSILLRDDAGGMEPALTFVHGIRLAVRAEDAEAARELLADDGSEPPDGESSDSYDDEPER